MEPRVIAAVLAGAVACHGPTGPQTQTHCDVAKPGVYCGVTVGFSPYVTDGPFRAFHGVDTTAAQPDISITFSPPVNAVTVTALGPDGENNRMIAYTDSTPRDTAYFAGDGDPDVYTTATRSVSHPGITRIVLDTDEADPYTAYTNLRFTNAAGSCAVGRPTSQSRQTFCGVAVTFTPYATAIPYQTFQSVSGTVAQVPETLTFSQPVTSVTVTALDPDVVDNRIVAYNAFNEPVDSAFFDGDGTANTFTTSTKAVTGQDLRMVVLWPGTGEYIAYNGLRFTKGR